MRQFVRRSWLQAHAGVPIATAYVLAALVMGLEGEEFGAELLGSRVSPISSSSAIAILSAIASGTMALTAIVFSLVFIAIQLGNTTYSPRLIRGMGGRHFFAHALGVFTGTFLYALTAIRTVDITGGPGINTSVVLVAFVWLLASVVTVVLMLPRLRGMALGDILTALRQRASVIVNRLYPRLEAGADGVPRAASPPALAITGTLRHRGPPMYLVGLDPRRLARLAAEADATIVVTRAIGDAVAPDDALVEVLGASRPIAESRLRGALWLADERQIDNDPAYALRMLVDIAIRALSPAINDPTTAVAVLDELDGLLRLLGRRHLEANTTTDDRGDVRVVRAVASWDDLLALALTEIHAYGRDSVQVDRRLATLLHDLHEVLPPCRRGAIARFARWRAGTLVELDRDVGAWLDPSGIDRQGIGHAQIS